MVGPRGRVIACDRDADRLATLASAAARARAGAIIAPRHADFLRLDPSAPGEAELAAVRAIILDPSCSGSGTAAVRDDRWLAGLLGRGGAEEGEEGGGSGGGGGGLAPAVDAARLERLAAFQEAALVHALSAFPAAARVTYSTCSIHVRENEAVVAAALASTAGRAAGWRVEAALPAWPRRGIRGAAPGLSDEEADALVRVDPLESDGFFVALLVRDR